MTNAELFESYVPYPVSTLVYEADEIDLGFDDTIRVWGDIYSNLGPGVLTGVANPQLEIDYKTAAGSYAGFQSWGFGEILARYVKMRLVVTSPNDRIVVSQFVPSVDVLPKSDGESSVSVSSGGESIVFNVAFHAVPRVTATVVSATAAIVALTNITTTGFDVKVFNKILINA